MDKLSKYLPSMKLDLISSYFYLWAGISACRRFPHLLEIKWDKTWLALKKDFSRSRLSHLYRVINKAKKKSNQGSDMVSIPLIYPLNTTVLFSKKERSIRWFAVLLWPLVVLVILVYLFVELICPLVLLACPIACPLVASVCPLVVSVFPLVVLVVLSVDLFIADRHFILILWFNFQA